MQKELPAVKEKPPAPSVEATREFHQGVVKDTQQYTQKYSEIEQREKRRERASKQWVKEEGALSRLWKSFDMEAHLFKKRITLQNQRKAELEDTWGEGNVVGVIYHTHTSGSSEANYKGSPDGMFTLNTARPKEGESPRLRTLLKKTGIEVVFITDHDVVDFDEMNNSLDALNKKGKGVKFIGGTEMTSKEGHFIIMEGPSGKPVKNVPPAKTPVLEVARWAFDNGYEIMIPHPNPTYTNPKRIAEGVFGIDIGIEKETVEEILKLADEYDRLVYIAASNGTTNEDYKKRLLTGTRETWWAFWKRKVLSKETKDLYQRRAVWIDESDGHVQCEYPSGVVYFRRDKITDSQGRISQEKIRDAVKEQKGIEVDAAGEWKKLQDKDCVMASYNADKDFNVLDRVAEIPYFFWEYGRLAIVWLSATFRGEAKQFAPEQKYTYEPRKEANLRSQYDKMAELEE